MTWYDPGMNIKSPRTSMTIGPVSGIRSRYPSRERDPKAMAANPARKRKEASTIALIGTWTSGDSNCAGRNPSLSSCSLWYLIRADSLLSDQSLSRLGFDVNTELV